MEPKSTKRGLETIFLENNVLTKTKKRKMGTVLCNLNIPHFEVLVLLVLFIINHYLKTFFLL